MEEFLSGYKFSFPAYILLLTVCVAILIWCLIKVKKANEGYIASVVMLSIGCAIFILQAIVAATAKDTAFENTMVLIYLIWTLAIFSISPVHWLIKYKKRIGTPKELKSFKNNALVSIVALILFSASIILRILSVL